MSVTGLKIAMMAMTKMVALVQVGVQKLRSFYVRQQPLLFFFGCSVGDMYTYSSVLFIFLPLLYCFFLCVVCVPSLTHATVCNLISRLLLQQSVRVRQR